jgi:protein-disulfide isomerase
MRDGWERILSTLLTLAAVTIAVVLVRREFFSTPVARPSSGEPQYVSTWRDILHIGRVDGDTLAPIKLIEFADLECPFCRTFNSTLQDFQKRHPNQVTFVFVHLPLSMHRFARPAARAVECAHPFGKFHELVDVIYDKQDSLGLKSWSSYALEAGVIDTLRFVRCVSETSTLPMVEAGIAAARRLNVTGTPTVIINGWRYDAPPSASELDQAVADIRAGKKPGRSAP